MGNSNEIQSVLRTAIEPKARVTERKNAKSNLKELCPWAATQKRLGAQAHVKDSKVRKALDKKVAAAAAARKAHGKKSTKFYKGLQEAHAPAAPEAAEEE